MGTVYAMIESGIVTNVVVWNGDTDEWTPPEDATMVLIEDGQVPHIGLGYANGIFEQPPVPVLNPDDVKANNSATRDALLEQAAIAIAPLQDAVDLEVATDAETSLLRLWKQYRVAVNRVDLTLSTPVWPRAPSA